MTLYWQDPRLTRAIFHNEVLAKSQFDWVKAESLEALENQVYNMIGEISRTFSTVTKAAPNKANILAFFESVYERLQLRAFAATPYDHEILAGRPFSIEALRESHIEKYTRSLAITCFYLGKFNEAAKYARILTDAYGYPTSCKDDYPQSFFSYMAYKSYEKIGDIQEAERYKSMHFSNQGIYCARFNDYDFLPSDQMIQMPLSAALEQLHFMKLSMTAHMMMSKN